jgi:hypothetical protein
MQATPSKNIYTRLIAFQSIMPVVGKDKNNPFYKVKYADLPAIQKAIQQPLSSCGLGYYQITENGELKTVVFSEAGEKIEFYYPFNLQGKAQEIGSAITYAKRYSLVAVLGLIVDDEEDDDGNTAQQSQAEIQSQSKYTSDDRPWLKETQLQAMLDWISSGKRDEVRQSMNKYKMKKEYKTQLEAALNSHIVNDIEIQN